MPQVNNPNLADNWPSPNPDEPGEAVPRDGASTKLWLAANSPKTEKSAVNAATAAAGITDFLIKRQAIVLEVLADFTDQTTLSGALLTLTNELHHRFQCDRVAIGLINNDRLDVAAISQQAVIDARTNEIRMLSAAMQEACEQETPINYPEKNKSLLLVESHQALTVDQENGQVCTILLCDQEAIIGALLLQRRAELPWSRMTLELFTQIATLTAPLIALRRDAERGLVETLRIRTRKRLASFIEPKHLLAKGASLIAALIIAFAYFLPVAHHVKASAEIVPTERRVISAPINGFVSAVFVNAGDIVSTGDILLRLDTRELELKQAGQENQILSARADLRAAMASYDRSKTAVAQAQLDQLEAELALTKQQISRTTMTAPVDGVIVSGDLTQSLGVSVERGKALLEMAPTTGYEVHLLVNEVDVPYVHAGQIGQLSLSADPGDERPVEVSSIHPIARASGGVNRFLVETTLDQEIADLRPGQTGIVKLVVGEASLLWVLTHRFLEWSRQRLWEWIG